MWVWSLGWEDPWRRVRQPTPVFLPGDPMDRGSWHAVVHRVAKSWTLNSVKYSRLVVSDSVTPLTAARQASLSITNSQSPPKLMSIESVMLSNHLIHCRPLLLLPSIFPSTRVFSNESALCTRWPKCWSFSFDISPSNEHPGLISFRMDSEGVFPSTTVLKHQFFCSQLSL